MRERKRERERERESECVCVCLCAWLRTYVSVCVSVCVCVSSKGWVFGANYKVHGLLGVSRLSSPAYLLSSENPKP